MIQGRQIDKPPGSKWWAKLFTHTVVKGAIPPPLVTPGLWGLGVNDPRSFTPRDKWHPKRWCLVLGDSPVINAQSLYRLCKQQF